MSTMEFTIIEPRVEHLLRVLDPPEIPDKLKNFLDDFIEGLPSGLYKAVLYCSVPHWFNLDYVKHFGLGDASTTPEEVLSDLTRLWFVEEYGELGYSFKTPIRNALMDHFWGSDRQGFKELSGRLAAHFGSLIAQHTDELIRMHDGMAINRLKRLILELKQEMLYHLLIAAEYQGVSELSKHLTALRLEENSSAAHSLLQTATEHISSNRLSEQTKRWLRFMKARLANDAGQLKELLENSARLQITSSKQAAEFKACISLELSSFSASRGDQRAAWQQFFRSRDTIGRRTPTYESCFLYDSCSPLNFQDPTPADWLWLGMNLTNRPSKRLFGRKKELRELQDWLSKSGQHTFVIHGLGGIGKTRLAYALARIALDKGFVEDVVWTSAKEETFIGEHIDRLPDRPGNRAALRTTIETLFVDDPTELTSAAAERVRSFRDYIRTHRTLVVIDNIETLSDSDRLLRNLPDILGESRLIITSRVLPRVLDAGVLRLHGLEEDESLELVKWTAKDFGLKTPALSFWRDVHKFSSGSPLVIQFAVSQLANQSARTVVEMLAKGTGEIFDYIFSDLSTKLSSVAMSILHFLSITNRPAPKSVVEYQIKMAGSRVSAALVELQRKALIEGRTNLESDEVVYTADNFTSSRFQHRDLR